MRRSRPAEMSPTRWRFVVVIMVVLIVAFAVMGVRFLTGSGGRPNHLAGAFDLAVAAVQAGQLAFFARQRRRG